MIFTRKIDSVKHFVLLFLSPCNIIYLYLYPTRLSFGEGRDFAMYNAHPCFCEHYTQHYYTYYHTHLIIISGRTCILVFPSKIWAKKCMLSMTKYGIRTLILKWKLKRRQHLTEVFHCPKCNPPSQLRHVRVCPSLATLH